MLDRQRGRVGHAVAAGFFGRINERIEASARAEDEDDEPASGQTRVAQARRSGGSGEGEQAAEHEAVDKQ